MRVYIVGVSTSGKTTLAKRIARKIGSKHYDLDDFFFKKKYYETRTQREIEKLVRQTINKKKWVIEGSYSGSRWVKWIAKKADVFIWLDKPSHVIAWRIVKREFTRPKPHPKHSRIASTFGLLNFLRHYKTQYHAKTHRKLAKSHLRGYILKTNRQIEEFLKKF